MPRLPRSRDLAKLTAGICCAVFLVVVIAGSLATSCYRPAIDPGGFACNPIYDTGKGDCPKGFFCADNRCWPNGAGPDAGGGADKPVDKLEAPAEKPDVLMDVPKEEGPPPVCIPPVANCTPKTDQLCDPVCQTGSCNCDQKCSVSTPIDGTAGALTCNKPSTGLVRTVGKSCSPVSQGKLTQTDDCAPGLACIQTDTCGSGTCFKFCRTNDDCGPKSSCSRTLSGFKFCDVETTVCNPVTGIAGGTGCEGAAQGCYLSESVADETRCDCPFGEQKENQPCDVSRNCLAGLVCAAANGTASYFCHPACKLPSTGCKAGQMCTSINGSTIYGACI